jgi:hypothetical protein
VECKSYKIPHYVVFAEPLATSLLLCPNILLNINVLETLSFSRLNTPGEVCIYYILLHETQLKVKDVSRNVYIPLKMVTLYCEECKAPAYEVIFSRKLSWSRKITVTNFPECGI